MTRSDRARRLELAILPQPDDSTCGPTCLQAVYRYHGDRVHLARLITEISPQATGGHLAVQLACHALKSGYDATIYTYNLRLFDPTWFDDSVDIADRLRAQAKIKEGRRIKSATRHYLEFLELGGDLRYEDLTEELIIRYLDEGLPVLTGLSATYLYGCAREVGEDHLVYDDVRGFPTGHFVVLYGHNRRKRAILVADPLQDNPGFRSHYYALPSSRVIAAILLGDVTWDANLLILRPTKKRRRRS
jgi:hypothetical protein